MKNKNDNTLLLILGGLAVTAVGYFVLKPGLTKTEAIAVLVAAVPARNADAIASYADDYVIAWGKAVKAGQTTFSYLSKAYNSSTGKAIPNVTGAM